MNEATISTPRRECRLRVDHISIAVPRIDEALSFFRRSFPVEMNSDTRAGYSADFNWCDFFVGDFKLELIESAQPDSFVERFLKRHGEGMHHWSLETTDMAPLLERMEAGGLRIVDRFKAGDFAETAFVSPRSTRGVLIQLWQVPEIDTSTRTPETQLTLRTGKTIRLRVDHISFAVRDIDATLEFYRTYLPFELRREPHVGWDGTFFVASFYVNGYKVELIQNVPGKPGFVERFISQHGEGFHHLSIDVDDIDAYVAQLEADNVRVVDKVDLRGGYKTAFISPRSAHGVLIQLWQTPRG